MVAHWIKVAQAEAIRILHNASHEISGFVGNVLWTQE